MKNVFQSILSRKVNTVQATGIFIFLLFWVSKIHAQDLAWAASFGGTNAENGTSLTVDQHGNMYATGDYMSTMDCDPGPGVYNLAPNYTSAFIIKLDANGNFKWAKRLGGTGEVQGKVIRVDTSGNVYTVGRFNSYFQNSPIDFDPGPGTYNLSSYAPYNFDVYISKLDSMGNFVWAKKIGNAGDENISGLTLDSHGNPTYTGNFNQAVDFNPGAGSFIITPTYMETYISKLDASGNFLWAKHFASVPGGGYQMPYAITTDEDDNIYTTGSFYWTVDFDPGAGVHNISVGATTTSYISKLDSAGNFVWANQIGAPGSVHVTALATDHLNRLCLTGEFSDTADFDPGAGVTNLISNGPYNDFIAQFDLAGNFVWAKHYSDSSGSQYQSIATDQSNNIYVTGNFSGTADFDPGPGVYNLVTVGGIDAYIAKFDSSGNFTWALQMGSTGSSDAGVEIVVSPSYKIYSIGLFGGTIDIDPGPGIYNLTSNGQTDFYIQQLSQCFPLLPVNTTPAANLIICGGDSAILSASGNNNLEWYSDSIGGIYIGAGNVFTTPILTDTTTFYVYDTTQCTLDRTAITVNVIPNSTSITNTYICVNQTPYIWNAQSLDSTGLYTAVFTGINGCDSIATLNLTVSPCIVCVPDFTINYSPFYNSLTESQSWIITSGTVLIEAGTQVKLDAHQTSYVMINPGFKADSGSVFVAQAYNGCTAGAPQLPQLGKALNEDPFAFNEIVLYPNPTSGMIHIRHDEKLTGIQIFDMVGKLVINQKCTGETETNIDLSNLPNGVYQVKAARYHSIKVIKNN
jgi:hypothetical protein